MKNPVKIGTLRVRCPLCGSPELEVTDYLYEVPGLGHVLITVGTCPRCGYSFRDVRSLEGGEPRRIVFRVESEEDINVMVLKSSKASIILEEMGASMDPGPASESFITTVEGIIDRFLEALSVACRSRESDKACREAREKLEAMKSAKTPFTLVVIDPEGASIVSSPKARYEPLQRRDDTGEGGG